MGETSTVDPLAVSKDMQLIKDAQKDIGKLDVLVCGECCDVFHFVEEFQEHKTDCKKNSELKQSCATESKSQVWAYTLWKQAQIRAEADAEKKSSLWILFQRWCKMDAEQKSAWVRAGDEIHNYTKIAAGKIQEIKLRNQQQQSKAKKIGMKPKLVTVSSLHGLSSNQEDPLDEGEIAYHSEKDNSEVDPLADSEMDTEEEASKDAMEEKANDLIKKGIIKPVRLNSDVTILPSVKKTNTTKKAIRTSKEDNNKEEYAVEKILAKRFNQKKKTLEYLVKWENFDNSQNTWEPAAHITGCKLLLEEFERKLQKQKEMKATAKIPMVSKQPQNKQQQQQKTNTNSVNLTPGGRPQRTSKQKALNQVKVWCGDISDADEGGTTHKRKIDRDDSDSDSYDKKLKLEDYTDSSEEEKPMITIKKIKPSPASVNGVGKKNLLLTDAQGVVRLNPKQMSSLSSGVYIMNKTKGLMKLDSNTANLSARLAMSGSSTPKVVGQTRIKIIRSGGASGGTPTNQVNQHITAKPATPLTVVQKPRAPVQQLAIKTPQRTPQQQQPAQLMKIAPKAAILKTPPIKESPAPLPPKSLYDDDSDDGLEELEFPTDLPIPPDSPPREFILDPMTGKLAGEPDEPEKLAEENRDKGGGDEGTKENEEMGKVADGETAALPIPITSAGGDDDLRESDEVKNVIDEVMKIVDENKRAAAAGESASAKTNSIIAEPPKQGNSADIDESNDSLLKTLEGTDEIIPSLEEDPLKLEKAVPQQQQSEGTPKTAPVVTNKTIMATIKQVKAATPDSLKKGAQSNSSILCTALTDKSSKNAPEKKLLSTPNMLRQKGVLSKQSPGSANLIQKRGVPGARPVKSQHFQQQQRNKGTYNTSTPIITRLPPKTYGNKHTQGATTTTTTVYKKVAQPQQSKTILPLQSSNNAVEITARTPAKASAPVHNTQTGVISMPSLLAEEEPALQPQPELQSPEKSAEGEGGAAQPLANLSTAYSLTGETESPLFITGDDGTIYQIAGQNEQGQTVLISEGPDGQQQCLVVATENLADISQAQEENNTTALADTAEQTQLAQQSQENQHQQPLMVTTDEAEAQAENGDSQVDAQIVKAEPPSPGGTRKVLLLLPDGNLMMTELSPEQYSSLELDK